MIGNTFAFGWELAFQQWLQQFGSGFGLKLATLFSMFSEDVLMLAIIGTLYWGFNKEWAKRIATDFVIGLLSASIVKNIVKRRRPYFDHEEIQCLRPSDRAADPYDLGAQGFSFPSIHASNSMTMYGSTIRFYSAQWFHALIVLLLTGIGLSRVILGVHYVTDVLAGWLIGGLAIFMGGQLQKRVPNRLIQMAILAVLALPGWFFCISDDFYASYGLVFGFMLSFWLDENVIHFPHTKNPIRIVLRTAGGLATFLVLDMLLKKLFALDMFTGSVFVMHLMRSIRYFVISFVSVGVYPAVFRK